MHVELSLDGMRELLHDFLTEKTPYLKFYTFQKISLVIFENKFSVFNLDIL